MNAKCAASPLQSTYTLGVWAGQGKRERCSSRLTWGDCKWFLSDLGRAGGNGSK